MKKYTPLGKIHTLYIKPGKTFDPHGFGRRAGCVYVGYLEEQFACAIAMFGIAAFPFLFFAVVYCLSCGVPPPSSPSSYSGLELQDIKLDVGETASTIAKTDALLPFSDGNLYIFHGEYYTTYRFNYF
jgi:hypothetical protein